MSLQVGQGKGASCCGLAMATGAAGLFASHQLRSFTHVAGHPHGLLGNAYFLAFCTHQLGFEEKVPGIRLSIGEVVPQPWSVGVVPPPAAGAG